jgi:hypothetical protein
MNLEVFTPRKSFVEYAVGLILLVVDLLCEAVMWTLIGIAAAWKWSSPQAQKLYRELAAWLKEDPVHPWIFWLFLPSLYFGFGFVRLVLIVGLGAHALPLPSVDWWWVWILS